MRVFDISRPPNVQQQLPVRQHFAGIVDQHGQQPVFNRRQANFPVADMNRNVLWKNNVQDVDQADIDRMNAFWGDESWRDVAYSTENNLFGYAEKESNKKIAEGFQARLKKVAGFGYVPEPMPMRNSNGATIYYLFFASQKATAQKIIDQIFKKYRDQGIK